MAYELVVMGTSWGGLNALRVVLRALPAGLAAAVLVVQHRHRDSENLLAGLLQDECALPVCEVEDKMPLERGQVHLAPPDYHVLVEGDHVSLSTDAPVHYSRPSIDVTFMSAADAFGPSAIGVVMTGANDDGAAGLRRIVERGGRAIVQSPQDAECAIMPAAAIRAVPEAEVLPLAQLGPRIVSLVGRPKRDGDGAARPDMPASRSRA